MTGAATLPSPASQEWLDKEYCERYHATWEISTDDVHYGWLSDGDSKLCLLGEVGTGDRVLDVGCGGGENLCALAKRDCEAYGIDISPHMIERARLLSQDQLVDSRVYLDETPMQTFHSFAGVNFDRIISVYSFEYLTLAEFRDVLHLLNARLNERGSLVFCFSHPLQHTRHADLHNQSARSSESLRSPTIFSFRDAVGAIASAGFEIERVVEQQTLNPSTLTYEQARAYPYHFQRGQSPFEEKYDTCSNAAPHTVIYKCTKPSTIERSQTISFEFTFDKIELWGENRTVVDEQYFSVQDRAYSLIRLKPYDSLYAICVLASFVVEDVHLSSELNDNRLIDVPPGSLLEFAHRQLESQGLGPSLRRAAVRVPEFGERVESVYLDRVDPISGMIGSYYPRKGWGILVFLNGAEPGDGTVGLQSVFPKPGDRIEVVQVVTDWGSEWRPQRVAKRQLQLFRNDESRLFE